MTKDQESEKPRVAFIGLGTMGFPMAGHLKRVGHDVCVFNRTRDTAERWVKTYEGRRADSPREAAHGADYVFLCVGNDADVRAATHGDRGALAGCRQGTTLVDHTTTSATLAGELEQAAAKRGVAFLDAPVSGGERGAINGQLTCMVGGEEEVFERARDVMKAYAAKLALIGPCGSGQLTKMVNQICIAGLLQGLAEGLHLGQAAGLDMQKVVEVISKGAAQSWQMDNRAHTMLAGEFEFGFAVRWMIKDLNICLQQAKQLGVALPITSLVEQRYQQVESNGGARWDTSSLITLLAKPAVSTRGTS